MSKLENNGSILLFNFQKSTKLYKKDMENLMRKHNIPIKNKAMKFMYHDLRGKENILCTGPVSYFLIYTLATLENKRFEPIKIVPDTLVNLLNLPPMTTEL